MQILEPLSHNLTLTRVVFELNTVGICWNGFQNLTLTRVVFEYGKDTEIPIGKYDLTLTRVVFEFKLHFQNFITGG